jgi:hypothetical protein
LDIDTRIERYGRASRQDDGALAVLFTEEALYASLPLNPQHHDREGINAYRRRATADQEGAARCSTWREPRRNPVRRREGYDRTLRGKVIPCDSMR